VPQLALPFDLLGYGASGAQLGVPGISRGANIREEIAESLDEKTSP
jgi:hypothetical protein